MPKPRKSSHNNAKLSQKETTVTNSKISGIVQEKVQEQVPKVVKKEIEATFRSGPLPIPEELAAYNEIIPGAAERILQMAEDEQNFRHDISKDTNTSTFSAIKRGQIFALIISIVCVSGTVLLGYFDQPWPATVLGGASLVSITKILIEQWHGNNDKPEKENSTK